MRQTRQKTTTCLSSSTTLFYLSGTPIALSSTCLKLTYQSRNHNWFQGLNGPLPPIPLSSPTSLLTSPQRARLGFYHALIKSTRLLHGSILVLSSPPSKAALIAKDTIHAILLWLPPHHRLTLTKLPILYQSGLLSTILSYGPSALYRISFVFEANIDALFASAGIDAAAAGFVQMLAASQHPACRGKGSASRLLAWQIARHEEMYPGADVLLDTTTAAAKRAYERLGFVDVGSKIVDTATDALGFRLASGADEEARQLARTVTVQRVMQRRAGMRPTEPMVS